MKFLFSFPANLRKLLQHIVESKTEEERDAFLGKLQPIVTGANIANDECDFGTSLELGLDLFSFGGAVLHRTALNLLKTSYCLLHREEFAQIAEVSAVLMFYEKTCVLLCTTKIELYKIKLSRI